MRNTVLKENARSCFSSFSFEVYPGLVFLLSISGNRWWWEHIFEACFPWSRILTALEIRLWGHQAWNKIDRFPNPMSFADSPSHLNPYTRKCIRKDITSCKEEGNGEVLPNQLLFSNRSSISLQSRGFVLMIEVMFDKRRYYSINCCIAWLKQVVSWTASYHLDIWWYI